MPQNLCPVIRGRIVGQWQGGKSVAEIAAAIPCSEKAVRRWIKRFTEGGDHALHDHRRNNRGPRKTKAEEDERIVAVVVEQPFVSVQEAINAANIQVSERTARRRLNEAGYHCSRHSPRSDQSASNYIGKSSNVAQLLSPLNAANGRYS